MKNSNSKFVSPGSFLILGAIASLASACSLKQGDDQHVRIALPQTSSSAAVSLLSSFALPGSARLFDVAPATLDGFNCYGINVTATDIPTDDRIAQGCVPAAGQLYPGLVQGLVPVSDGFIDAVVPSGPARTFQLVGVMSANGCPRIDDLINSNGNQVGDPYDIGRATVDVMGDTSVTIKEIYNTANAQKAFCTGNHDGGPYALKLEPANPQSPYLLGTNQCTPLYVNAYDQSGKRYSMPAGSGGVTVSVGSSSAAPGTVNLYGTSDSTCAGTAVATGGASANFTIPAGSSSVVLYAITPNAMGSFTLPLSTSASGWSNVQSFAGQVTNKYFTMTAASPAANTCVAMTVNVTSSGSTVNAGGSSTTLYPTVQAFLQSGNAVPPITFYANSTDCGGSVNPLGSGSQTVSIPMVISPSAAETVTFYVKSAAAGGTYYNFSLYDGAATPAIATSNSSTMF